MRYAIAIDVGLRNLGMCVFDFTLSKFIYWDNCSLIQGARYTPSQNVRYVRDFIQRHQQYFDECMYLIVERQMRCNMRIIETVFHSMFYDRCYIIDPKSVKAHYNISLKNYKLNKARAVEWATDFVSSNPRAFISETPLANFTNHKKKDDLADALLLLAYFLDTYSLQTDDCIGFSIVF